MSTTRLNSFAMPGSFRSASATFCERSDGDQRDLAGLLAHGLDDEVGGGLGTGCLAVKSSAQANWILGIGRAVLRPTATGTSSRPPACSSLHATFARAGVSPSVMVTPSSSMSGDCIANPSAHASSMSPPMSVSRITLRRCADASAGRTEQHQQDSESRDGGVSRRVRMRHGIIEG